MWRQTWAEVDLQRLRENLGVIRKVVGARVQVMASVKANAYGHGAVEVSRELLTAGADQLGVASIEEGLELREAGITAPLLCYGALPLDAEEVVTQQRIAVTVMREQELKRLAKTARMLGQTVAVHVKLDTGMGRLGVRDQGAALQLLQVARSEPGIELAGIYTHFSSADEAMDLPENETDRQADRFEAIIAAARAKGISARLVHAANSAAIFRSRRFHYDMVRPGIALYGYHPFMPRELTAKRLQPVLSLYSRVTRVAEFATGDGVSYGRTFICARPEVIATLPIGYADGVPRLLSGRGSVKLAGAAAPIAGRVCMDQMMVVVTDLPVQVGDVAQLYGESEGSAASLTTAADQVGTISYELLCAISARVPRYYLESSPLSSDKLSEHFDDGRATGCVSPV